MAMATLQGDLKLQGTPFDSHLINLDDNVFFSKSRVKKKLTFLVKDKFLFSCMSSTMSLIMSSLVALDHHLGFAPRIPQKMKTMLEN